MTDGTELVVEAAPTGPTTLADSERHHDKVGGWLLFFCVTLVLVNPLTSIGFTGYGLLSIIPVLSRLPLIAIVVTGLDTMLSLILVAFSFYAGTSLLRKQPSAVSIAKAFLYAGAVYTIVSPLLWLLPGIPRDASVPVFDTLIQSWRGLLYYAIWLNYLRTSKRVKATYGTKEFPPNRPMVARTSGAEAMHLNARRIAGERSREGCREGDGESRLIP